MYKSIRSLFKTLRVKTKDHIFTDLETASLLKYSITHFSLLCVFFNELHSIFENLNVSDTWESFINIISKDKRIGNSHMEVPGHDGKKGFGGACFPKDSTALLKYSKNINSEFKLLKAAVKINNKIRSKYDELDQRERQQNISSMIKFDPIAQVVKLVDTRDLKLEGNFVPVRPALGTTKIIRIKMIYS